MSDGQKAFIMYEWGPEHERKTMTFSRQEVLSNANRLLVGGDTVAPGESEDERAAWRVATKRGISKLAGERESLVSDGTREAVQAWLYDNAHVISAAVQDGAQTVLDTSSHLVTNAIHDAMSGWLSRNSDQIRSAIRAAALQAAREANI
jgi:hypothetical protein